MTEKEALTRAASLCSTAEHCISDITDKLTRWGIDEDAQQSIIERLLSEKYIDELRYAKAYAHDKLRYNHWGRIRIDMQLRQLGICDAHRREALEALDEEEYQEILAQVIRQKLPTIKASSDYERNCKLLRFLYSRGFTSEEADI